LNDETEEEINEIITKNYLQSKSIPFKKLGEYAAGGQTGPPKSATKEENKKEEAGGKKAEANEPAEA